jgi:hypothetical protein
MAEWQPIETAPKDGTRILVVDCGFVQIARWDEEFDNYNDRQGVPAWATFACDDGFYSEYAENPTHWMPLPEPPRVP